MIAFTLILCGSSVISQISQGTERHAETTVGAQYTTTTTTVVKRSFDPLLLVPGVAGLALGLVFILSSRPIARLLILGVQQGVQPPGCTEPRESAQDENRIPVSRGR